MTIKPVNLWAVSHKIWAPIGNHWKLPPLGQITNKSYKRDLLLLAISQWPAVVVVRVIIKVVFRPGQVLVWLTKYCNETRMKFTLILWYCNKTKNEININNSTMVLRKFNQIYSQKQVTGLYEESIITLVVFINKIL